MTATTKSITAKTTTTTTTPKPMPNFRFTVASLSAVEGALGKSIGTIVAEMSSKTGMALTTLRALVAAGKGPHFVNAPAALYPIDLIGADAIIVQHGTAAVATAIAEPLRKALEELA